MVVLKRGRYRIVGTAGPNMTERLAMGAGAGRRSESAPSRRARLKRTKKPFQVPVADRTKKRVLAPVATRKQQPQPAPVRVAKPKPSATRAPVAALTPAPRSQASIPTSARAPKLEKVASTTFGVLCQTVATAKALQRQSDRDQVNVLLVKTDAWFAERLEPTAAVVAHARRLTSVARWAGMDYDLIERLNQKQT
jgi:hypothetical protein